MDENGAAVREESMEAGKKEGWDGDEGKTAPATQRIDGHVGTRGGRTEGVDRNRIEWIYGIEKGGDGPV